jgi:hypothetical protein
VYLTQSIVVHDKNTCVAGMPHTSMSRRIASMSRSLEKDLHGMLSKCLGRDTGDVGKTRCPMV